VGLLRRPTKTADWRDVPLTTGAADALARQLKRCTASSGREPAPSHYVFPGGADASIPARPDSLADRWASARGSSPVTLLHLRHYAATAMLDAGESYRTVADILGNSESTLRLHYDGRTDVGKRRAVSALELGAEESAPGPDGWMS
jgi:integrase